MELNVDFALKIPYWFTLLYHLCNDTVLKVLYCYSIFIYRESNILSVAFPPNTTIVHRQKASV